MNNTSSLYKVLCIVAFVTLLISIFWGLFFKAPSVIKAIFSLGIWIGILLIPYNNSYCKTDFPNSVQLCLKGLLCVIIIAILRSVFNTDADMYAFGNKWITLFFNEYTALCMCPPLFIYLGAVPKSVSFLKKVTFIFLIIGLSGFLTGRFPLSSIAIYAGVLYPYVTKKKYKYLLLLSIGEALYVSFAGANPTRMYLLISGITIAAYVLVYIVGNIKYIKVFVVSLCLMPLFLFIPILSISEGETTFFQDLQEERQNMMGENDDDDGIATDTRTFLYQEMAEDLNNSKAWFWGKGAYSHYYSFYFDESPQGRFGRINSEVPFLTFLLRGGIVYVALYYYLLLYAIYNAVWRGKNKFVLSVGIITAGWLFNSFVGDIIGCRFYHLAFFLLVGCCLSKKWLNYTDEDIKMIMKK